jgi:hypothetical protein
VYTSDKKVDSSISDKALIISPTKKVNKNTAIALVIKVDVGIFNSNIFNMMSFGSRGAAAAIHIIPGMDLAVTSYDEMDDPCPADICYQYLPPCTALNPAIQTRISRNIRYSSVSLI